ncbi:DnaJ domain-containing protein [Methylocapsa sp. S129]|uniref:DnaJ domain-containing protein n=1 Tax=Methylocapsa sp. S129 TaxID=1641869 RepID=UPI00131DDACA|nr:DnaJ domain-containing protein [Methylocapsa sp. S129]
MPNLIAGLFLLYLVLAGIKQFARLSPALAARLVRQGGGVLGLIGALLLVLRGSLGLASLVASVAFGFAGWGKIQNLFSGLGARNARPAGGQKSSARSATLEMRLDHESGEMTGIVLSGPFQGRSLDMLTRPECLNLYATARHDDPDGARLLETYLDRRFARWRETAQDNGDARPGGGGSGAMTPDEAYQVLGLAQGAAAEEIVRAHRSLMKKLHPDHGGSTSLAARVNQAKDVLLRRH